jgi:hypothetical protein
MRTLKNHLRHFAMGLALIGILAGLSVLIAPQTAFAQALYGSMAWRSTGHLVWSNTAPTVTSAGTSPSVTASNGTANFIVNVGTGGTASATVMAMPTATAGWTCSVSDITAAAARIANQSDRQMASSTTSVTVEHFTPSTGAALAYTASDLVRFQCSAY